MVPRSEPASPQGCAPQLAGGLAVVLLLGGLILAFLGEMGLADRGPGITATYRLLAALIMAEAGCSLLNSLMTALFLAARSRRSWYFSLLTSLIGVGVGLGVAWAALRWADEERKRGGDTGPIGVVAAWAFGVIIPLVLATLPLGLLSLCLFRLRPRTIGDGEVTGVSRS
jgi:hypothetical protein